MRDPYNVRVLETCAAAAQELARTFEAAARGDLSSADLMDLVTMAGEKLSLVARNIHLREQGSRSKHPHLESSHADP